ncbi:MAG: YaaL family protein [Firmicutes bacterium]|nr:YaaL family protein [Bacillota bacterium]
MVEVHPVDDLEAVIEQARQEWVNARTFFDNVVDPDLVDYAIYSIEAAERKYMYLLRKARKQNAGV